MKSVRIAIYASIVIHFLRATARKLCPAAKKTENVIFVRRTPGNPPGLHSMVYVCLVRPTPPGPIPIVACADYATASAVRDFLNSRLVHYTTCTQYPKYYEADLAARALSRKAVPLPLNIRLGFMNDQDEFDNAFSFVRILDIQG